MTIQQGQSKFITVQSSINTLHCQRVTVVYMGIMLFAFPLFTGISGYNYLHLKKFLFFALMTTAWLLYLAIQSVRRIFCGGRFGHLSLLPLCILGFAIAATLSTIWAGGIYVFGNRYDGLVTHLLYAGILLGVGGYGKADIKLLYWFAAGYAICSLIALLQLIGWNALWLYPDGMTYYAPYVQEIGKFLGTIGNIDVLSAYHCLAIPMLSAAIIYLKKRSRFFLAIPVVLGSICQIWAGVSSGILALIVAAVVFVPLAYADIFLRERDAHAGWTIYLIAPLILFLSLVVLYLTPFHTGSLYEIHSILHGNVLDEYGSHRIQIWSKTIEIIKQYPLLGVGPENLVYYLDIVSERYSDLLGEMLYSQPDNAHNEYLQFIVTFGICGFTPIAVLVTKTAHYVLQQRSKSKLLSILTPGLTCYMIQAFFNIGLCIITPVACIAVGLVLSKHQTISRGEEPNPNDPLY